MDARKLLKLKKDFRDWCGVILIREIITNPTGLQSRFRKLRDSIFCNIIFGVMDL